MRKSKVKGLGVTPNKNYTQVNAYLTQLRVSSGPKVDSTIKDDGILSTNQSVSKPDVITESQAAAKSWQLKLSDNAKTIIEITGFLVILLGILWWAINLDQDVKHLDGSVITLTNNYDLLDKAVTDSDSSNKIEIIKLKLELQKSIENVQDRLRIVENRLFK